MLTALYASMTSVFYGFADFFGGVASKRDPAVRVTATAHLLAMVLFGVGVVIIPGAFSSAALLAGAGAGVAGGIGVAALYAALARGRMSVIAPVTAALAAVLPAVWSLAEGQRVSPVSLVGLTLAIVATVIVSLSSSDDEMGGQQQAEGRPQPSASPPRMPVSIMLAIVAGIGFGASQISFSFAPKDAGLWPLLGARVVSTVMLGAAALVLTRGVLVSRPSAKATVGAGLLDAAANVTLLEAIRIGPLAVASVLGSLYPVVTVLLARFVLHERLKGLQRVGIALSLVAVVLTSVGGLVG